MSKKKSGEGNCNPDCQYDWRNASDTDEALSTGSKNEGWCYMFRNKPGEGCCQFSSSGFRFAMDLLVLAGG